MDNRADKPTGTGGEPYIWLRYATQFTTGGRTHTIEIGIPVPPDASAETREKLIREAEAGMDQLSRHVENRVNQALQRNARVPEAGRPLQEPVNRGSTEASTRGYSYTGTISPAPASNSPTSSSSSSSNSDVPPTRQNAGVSMPLSPAMPGDGSGNMKLSQFMQYIRETWGLTPKQAMELLNVKTLNGMNYREALKQLQPLVTNQQGNLSATTKNSSTPSQPVEKPSNVSVFTSARSNSGSGNNDQAASLKEKTNVQPAEPRELKPTPETITANRTPTPSSSSVRPAPAPVPTPIRPKASTPSPATSTRLDVGIGAESSLSNGKEEVRKQSPTVSSSKVPIYPIDGGKVGETPRIYKFDEEEDKELDLEELDGKNDDTEQQQIMARIKLDELKEVRGTSVASPARLTVLQNVLNSQISDEQLQQLIEAAWGTTNVKKLKVDQVEALISWAKEDFFVDEVERVLVIIGEE